MCVCLYIYIYIQHVCIYIFQNDTVLTEITIEIEPLKTYASSSPANMTNHMLPSSELSVPAFKVMLEHSVFINVSSLSLNLKLVSYRRIDKAVVYEVCTGGLISVEFASVSLLLIRLTHIQ